MTRHVIAIVTAALPAAVVATQVIVLARLFFLSGWTQEELATIEGKSKQWVDFRLRFGRFLNFSGFPTRVGKGKSLSERRFCGYWERTDKHETNEGR